MPGGGSSGLLLLLCLPGHGNKANREHGSGLQGALFGSRDGEELLVRVPHRDDEVSSGGELVFEGLWYVVWSGGDDDEIKGGVLFPALIPIAAANGDVFVLEAL